MANARIDLEVGYKIDRRSYQQLIDSLKDVQVNAQKALDIKEFGTKSETEIKKVSAAAQELQGIMEHSWDHKLNQVNLTKLNTNLATAGKTATQFYNTLASGGKIGQAGADAFARSMMEANVELVKTNKLIDKMAVTFGNTIRYGISSSIFNTFSNSIRNAYEYTKQLDTSLNDIRIVSGKSANEMAELAVQANKAAQALGRTTLDYTKAATIFYQQGLDTDEVNKRTEVVLKAANVTGQSAAEVSEQLTAVWNGYQVQAEQLELYVDKLSAVAASSASNLEELSTGMSKVAAAANVMGVDIDQLTAQMSTIISVTRQAPESVGTALRTIYARIADIKAGIDGETSLGNYSGKMHKLGFDVLDASGNLKEMGDVIEEIGGKWATLTREQQISLAQTMAGTRQYNNLLTLFDNWDKYTQALNTSKTAAGKLQQQQDIYMESTEAHLKQMTAEAEELYSTLFNQDAARTFIDIITGGLKSLNGYIKTLGGGFNTFLGLGSQVINLFSGKIADSVGGFLEKRAVKQENKAIIKGQRDISDAVLNEHKMRGENLEANVIAKEAQLTKDILKVKDKLTQEEFQQLNYQKSRISLLEEEKKQLKQNQAENEKSAKEQVASAFTKTVSEKYKLYGNDIENPERIAQALEEAKSDLAYNTDKNDKETYATQGKIVEYLEKRLKLLQDIGDETDRLNDIEAEEDALTDNIKKKTDNAGKRLNLQNTLKYTTAILQGFSIVTGAIQTINDDAATAEEKATAAFNGFVGAGSAIANAFLPGSGILVQMAGSLLENLGLTKALADAFKTNAEREQEEIDKLKEFSQTMYNEYERLSGMVSDLKSQWDTYDSVVEILNKCTKGSNDWEEALNKVNSTVADILAKYPGLAKIPDIIEYTADGMMKLNEELYKSYIQQLQNETTVKQFTAIVSGNEASGRQLELDKKTNRNNAQNNFINQMVDNKFTGNNPYQSNEKDKYREEVTNSLGLDEATFNKLVDSAKNDTVAYNQQIQDLAKNMVDLGYATQDQADEFVSSMKKSQDSFAQLQTRTDDYSVTLANSMKLLTNTQWGGEGATGLKTVLYANEYQKAENSVTSAQDLHDYWAYAKNGGLDITRDTGKSDEAYTNLIADINERIGSGKYEVARDISDADVIRGADGSEAVVMYNTTTGENESHTLEEWARIVNEEEKLRASLTKDINDAASQFVDDLKDKTGLESDTLTKVFSDGFDISQLTEEEAAQVQAHKDEILSYYQEMTKDITDEDAKKIALDYMNNLDRELQDNWDAAAHAEVLKQQFKETVAQAAVNAEENYKLDKEGFQGYSNYIAEIAEQNDNLANSLKDDGKAVSIVTQSVMRMNKGIETLAKSMEDWNSVLKKSSKDSYEYYEALDGVKGGMADILDVEKSAISNNFIESHLDDINKAAEGNAEAIDRLRDAYADQIILDIAAKTDFDSADVTTTKDKMVQAINDIQADIPKIKIGAVDDADFIQSCQDLINSSNMTVEDANRMFASLGFEAEYETDSENTTVKVPAYRTVEQVTENTIDKETGLGKIVTESHVEPLPDAELTGEQAIGSLAVSTLDGKNVNKPKIKKLTKKAGGSMNNYSPKNPGGGSAGGKKGRGSGSSSKPSKKDPNKDELNRYQLVNVQLKEISKQLGKLDKEKNKLLGGKLLANLNAQIKLLNDQMTVTEAKLKIAQQEQAEVAGKLSGYGIKFDSEGNIANYAAIFKQEQAKLNAVYTKFNGMSKDAQEAYEDTVKTAEETWNKFKESITKYDNLIGETIPQLQQDIRDAFDKQTEIYIQEFNAEIKVRLDMSSAERDWNEFKRKVIDGIKDDDILGMATAKLKDFYSYYNEAGTAEIQSLTKQLEGQLEELRKQDEEGSADWYRDNRVKAIEDLKDNYDKIRKSLTDIVELEEEMQNKIIESIDDATKKLDNQVNLYRNITKQLEHNVELIKLIYGDANYGKFQEYYDKEAQNRKEELAFQTQRKEYLEQLLKYFENIGNTEAAEKVKEELDAVNESWASAIEDAIKATTDAFQNGIDNIFKELEDKLTGGMGLDYLEKEWELMSDNSNLILDNINKMQGLQELSKKYNDAINNTSNIKAQQKLAELRDSELESLKSMDSLSEKDLERAEKKLDIVKAQIALEDAQRNKSQMRLRRDSQGNYRYQFVADDDQITNAQNQLSAAYNDLYNFDKARYNETTKQVLDATKEFFADMKELEWKYRDDQDKLEQEQQLLRESYQEKYGILIEQQARAEVSVQESAYADLNRLYGENADNYNLMTEMQKQSLNDWEDANQTAFDVIFGLTTQNTENFQNMTKEEKRLLLEELVPQFKSGIGEMTDAISGEGGFEEVARNLWTGIKDNAEEYWDILDDIQETAKGTYGTIEEAQQAIIDKNLEVIETNSDLLDSCDDMIKGVSDQYEMLKDLMEQYERAANDAKQAAEDAYEYIMKAKEAEAKDYAENVDTGPTTGGTGRYDGTQNLDTTTVTPVAKKEPNPPFSATLPRGTALYNANGYQYPKGTQADRTVTVEAEANGRYRVWGSTFNPHTVYVDKNAVRYDTGGYTGVWGTEGRMAMLHEKELVLNKKDTANMLNAVDILRGITDSIGADVLDKMASMKANGLSMAMGANALDQNVHIEATFPGVTSSIEIQDALNNLVNMAAQRATRTR